MAIKKTELYSSLWASCDELRGGMDASQYKDYVLTMLFLKYISDRYSKDEFAIIEIPEDATFDKISKLKGNKEIGDKLNIIIRKIAEANNLRGVIDIADFNDEDKLGKGKDMIDRLTKLIGIFEGLHLADNRADGDDLLGDAYEYLMRHFATESGKSKGQFYTPAEVSRVVAKVVGIKKDTPKNATVYDPTCGSGSLLLKASDEAVRGLTIYGQEMDNATSALARMNMILHGDVGEGAKIIQGNTLSSPEYKDEAGQLMTFDFAVANPPFSSKNWTNGLTPETDEFDRFVWGVPPEKNGDFAFLLHIIKSLKSTGKAAVILPHGVLFRGNAEARIRESLIKQGYIKGIIGLPANLFYGTGIPASIIVIDKAAAKPIQFNEEGKVISGQSIFMIDASKGFVKDGNKNRLRHQDIHKIVDVFNKQLIIEGYSRNVDIHSIVANEYNLNIPRYIDSSEAEDLHDLSAHLKGGIPKRDIDALQNYWDVLPNVRTNLFEKDREGYVRCLVAANEVKKTILEHAEFKTFAAESLKPFTAWFERSAFKAIEKNQKPKDIMLDVSEDLLQSYADVKLLSKYDIYQIFMEYWDEVLQDDISVITQDGWEGAKLIRNLTAEKDNKLKEVPDLVIGKIKYKAEVIPPHLIVAKYFASEQAALDAKQAELDIATQELESFIEEHTADEGLLLESLNDKDKVTLASVKARLKLTMDMEEELVLRKVQTLFETEATLKKKVKELQEALDLKVFTKYPTLTDDEIKDLVVQDKWFATLNSSIEAEIERVTQQLANRVKELNERYAEPLPQITQNVEALSLKVAEHLNAMGLEW
ncbi:type I restriction-modification system subunit M [Acinetobacter baumannii]|uniref:type I restriction-modification system subunit M n=1 Tax=Acinetobacter baumannii TaxID=470 RepID=UPI0023422F6D|nr:type I restriction-modification system subunit M [Acinetobacter baumannii]MDC5054441.1 type I restriction-modification system subunit M [Acinetobacter baumannii]MDC5205663.1 type I restriction-modification system subunit M [Acinetobacter baumannii]MDO7483444.1 type I restriction-modification system subunit M [Acinetobacter baumannii]MDR9541863.1 type I restriction-modification system subunit M [Acinetobacter baumannii]MDV7405572.1 type I restriction-modification system subunit M [Acinetobac